MASNNNKTPALADFPPPDSAMALCAAAVTAADIAAFIDNPGGGGSSGLLTLAASDPTAALNLLVDWRRGFMPISGLDLVRRRLPGLGSWCEAVEALAPTQLASAVPAAAQLTRAASAAAAASSSEAEAEAEATISLFSEMVHSGGLRLSLFKSYSNLVPLLKLALLSPQDLEAPSAAVHTISTGRAGPDAASSTGVRFSYTKPRPDEKRAVDLIHLALTKIHSGKLSLQNALSLILPKLRSTDLENAVSLLQESAMRLQTTLPSSSLALRLLEIAISVFQTEKSMDAACTELAVWVGKLGPSVSETQSVMTGVTIIAAEDASRIRSAAGSTSFVSTAGTPDVLAAWARCYDTLRNRVDVLQAGLRGNRDFWFQLRAFYISAALDRGFRADFIAADNPWTEGPERHVGDAFGVPPLLDGKGCGLDQPLTLAQFVVDASAFRVEAREAAARRDAKLGAAEKASKEALKEAKAASVRAKAAEKAAASAMAVAKKN